MQRVCRKCGAPLPARSNVCYACGTADPGDGAAPGYTGSQDEVTLVQPARAQHAQVVLTASDGQVYELTELESTLGRSAGNAVVLDHPRVSRHHARILRYDQQVMIEDLNSSNGTFINGERMIGPAPLRDGDVISLGGDACTLTVSIKSPRPAAQPQSGMLSDDLVTQMPGTGRTVVAPPPQPLIDVTLYTPDGAAHTLTEQDNFLGRVATSTVQVESPQVSRQHARILLIDDQVLIEDLQSTNGTYVNRKRVTAPTLLKDGDVINLGAAPPLRISIREPVKPAPEPPPPPEPAPPAVAVPPDRSAGVERSETVVVARPKVSELVAPQRPAPAEIISLKNVVKRYRTGETEITILKGISLDIQTGDYVVLLGPSGCGKTTTLNMIIGADRPDSGEVIVAGQAINHLKEQDLARWRGKYIGVVFQFFQLLPTLNVIENVMLPMHITKTYPRRERRERAMEYLQLVGMAAMADRFPSALSGGQQQRIAIARALSCDPPILVADEPTGNLDSANSQMMFDLFVNLNRSGKTIVLVTHDPVLARSVPRKIEMLDGEIVK